MKPTSEKHPVAGSHWPHLVSRNKDGPLKKGRLVAGGRGEGEGSINYKR